MSENGQARLTSWKEIAAYLGRDVRTVLRWHNERGLPVHRIPGGKGRSVFAYREELDAWLRGAQPAAADAAPAPPATAPRIGLRRTLLPGFALIVLLAIVAGLSFGRSRPEVQAVTLRGRALVATAADGRELWSTPLASRGDMWLAGRRSVWIQDIDRDGVRDIIVALRIREEQIGPLRETLYCLTEKGQVRWMVTPDTRLRFGAGDFGPPWVTSDLVLFDADGRVRIAWALHHDVWWPGMVLFLGANGRIEDRFVNSGWITRLEVTADGNHVLAGGVSNARDAAIVAVLDARAPSGTSPEADASPFGCHQCPAGRPARYIVLPRSELNLQAGRALLDHKIEIRPDTVMLRIPQDTGNGAAEAIYELSSAFEVRRASFADVYWDWHRRLEGDGVIKHPAEACPERGGITVTTWHPALGWRNMRVTSTANVSGAFTAAAPPS